MCTTSVLALFRKASIRESTQTLSGKPFVAMTSAMFKYGKLPDVVAVTVAIAIGLIYEPDGWVLLLTGLIPMILSQVIFYSKLHKDSSEKKINIFGITRSRIIAGVLSSLLFSGGMIFVFYCFELLNSKTENLTNWVWISIFISRIIESVIPYSYWTIVEMDSQLYIKKFFGIRTISLLPEMSIPKISREKVELISEGLTWVLPLREEEIEKLLAIIRKVNATNID